MVFDKFVDWKYEKEWRLIVQHFGGVPYAEQSIDSIIFGLKMPEIERNKIKDIVRNETVKFYEAKRVKNEFRLEICPLDSYRSLPG